MNRGLKGASRSEVSCLCVCVSVSMLCVCVCVWEGIFLIVVLKLERNLKT